MNQKILFIADVQRGVLPVAELARRYDISRKTAYKWIDRFDAQGPDGLKDRSRLPLTCPHETPPRIVDAILQARWRHPRWGAKKPLAILERGHPDWPWPARSNVSDILRKSGLAPKRRRPGPPDSSRASREVLASTIDEARVTRLAPDSFDQFSDGLPETRWPLSLRYETRDRRNLLLGSTL